MKTSTKYELYVAYAGIRLMPLKFKFNIYSFDYIIINIKIIIHVLYKCIVIRILCTPVKIVVEYLPLYSH